MSLCCYLLLFLPSLLRQVESGEPQGGRVWMCVWEGDGLVPHLPMLMNVFFPSSLFFNVILAGYAAYYYLKLYNFVLLLLSYVYGLYCSLPCTSWGI